MLEVRTKKEGLSVEELEAHSSGELLPKRLEIRRRRGGRGFFPFFGGICIGFCGGGGGFLFGGGR
jgi:hypothetical protein